jgi:hypothetical protein
MVAEDDLPQAESRLPTIDDLKNYIVVRIADEIVVDLLIKAGGIDYRSAEKMIIRKTIKGVDIPFASPELLFQMNQILREKDKQGLQCLQHLLKNKFQSLSSKSYRNCHLLPSSFSVLHYFFSVPNLQSQTSHLKSAIFTFLHPQEAVD